jgi:DNA-binding transcriptional regulator YiaG
MANRTRTEKAYRMYIAGKERTLAEVTLTESPFDKKWAISVAEHRKINNLVCGEILSQLTTPFLFEELEFVRKYLQVSQTEVAKILEKDESTVSKWKKQQGGHLSPGDSLLLKMIFVEKWLSHLLEENTLTTDEVRRAVKDILPKIGSVNNVLGQFAHRLVNEVARQSTSGSAEIKSQGVEPFVMRSYQSTISIARQVRSKEGRVDIKMRFDSRKNLRSAYMEDLKREASR